MAKHEFPIRALELGRIYIIEVVSHFLLLSCLTSYFIFYLGVRWIQSWEGLERWRLHILLPSNLQYVSEERMSVA